MGIQTGIAKFIRLGPCAKILKEGVELLDDLVLNTSHLKTITAKKVNATVHRGCWSGYDTKKVTGAVLETIFGEKIQIPQPNSTFNYDADSIFNLVSDALEEAQKKGFSKLDIF